MKFVNRYSRLDRFLHRAAFASGDLQVSLSDIEDRLNADQLDAVDIVKPVFITALPRAGTTILLNLLHQTGEFASHTYKCMPFVLCPMFWQRFSNSIRTGEQLEMERAHADGITISIDSPEAFEEVIWSHFWKANYYTDRIMPWGDKRNEEFSSFFRNHLRKQILLAGNPESLRYLSKNNLNIARLKFLRSLYPDAIFVVPFRSPLQHAFSSLRQHLNFLHQHAKDRFARQYMRGIGHYDFGANFLPIDFDRWLEGDRRPDAGKLDFWIEYWIAAYRYVLKHADSKTHLVSFDQLTREPERVLGALSEVLQLNLPSRLVDQHETLRSVRIHEIDEQGLPKALIDAANNTYESLDENALNCTA